ncbi:MAG TPA: hypothetical protein VJ992_00130 [Gemmatimonadales bacterium]|nr:hypothetical protein [Gemmatimonadales bacterium]
MIATVGPEPRTLPPLEALRTVPGVSTRRHRIVSCYVRLDPEDRRRQRYLGEVKTRIKRLAADPEVTELPHEVREEVLRDFDRIETFLARPANLPSARGVAIFASEGLEQFDLVPLPHLNRSRVVLDHTPHVRELVAVADALDRVLVAVTDRAHARFFLVKIFEVEELPCLVSAATPGGRFHSDRQDAPGGGERAYHQRIRTERERHYDGVARTIADMMRAHAVDGLVLAGRDEDIARLTPFLSAELATRVWHTARINATVVRTDEVLDAAAAARAIHDRVADQEAIDRLAEGVGTGWATIGARETLRALGRGQVRSLLVAADAEGSGYRCSRTGLLATTPDDCEGQGMAVPVADIVDDAIEEALCQRIEIRTIWAPEDTAVLDGMSALLRFR